MDTYPNVGRLGISWQTSPQPCRRTIYSATSVSRRPQPHPFNYCYNSGLSCCNVSQYSWPFAGGLVQAGIQQLRRRRWSSHSQCMSMPVLLRQNIADYHQIDACRTIARTVQTSLGPYGRNKIVINHLAKMILTSDAATILRELEVVHPAAKLLVMASQQQEAEMGDATNMVIVLAGELLKKAEELIRMGLKTSDIVSGYEKAQNYALKCLEGMAPPRAI